MYLFIYKKFIIIITLICKFKGATTTCQKISQNIAIIQQVQENLNKCLSFSERQNLRYCENLKSFLNVIFLKIGNKGIEKYNFRFKYSKH